MIRILLVIVLAFGVLFVIDSSVSDKVHATGCDLECYEPEIEPTCVCAYGG